MNQPQHPARTSTELQTLRCLCGEVLVLPEPGSEWVLAAHTAIHADARIAVLPEELAESLPSTLDAATTRAELFAPDVAFDLEVANNVVIATGAAGGERIGLPTALAQKVVRALRRAALAFAVEPGGEELVGELDLAAIVLDEAIQYACAPGEAPRSDAEFLLEMGSDPGRLSQTVRTAIAVMTQPLLLLAPPCGLDDELINGRPARTSVQELAELPGRLATVERPLAGHLHRALATAWPLAVIESSVLDRMAGDIATIHLARLRATCLAETLAGSDDIDVVCWAAAAAERIIDRALTLTGLLEGVLACYD